MEIIIFYSSYGYCEKKLNKHVNCLRVLTMYVFKEYVCMHVLYECLSVAGMAVICSAFTY